MAWPGGSGGPCGLVERDDKRSIAAGGDGPVYVCAHYDYAWHFAAEVNAKARLQFWQNIFLLFTTIGRKAVQGPPGDRPEASFRIGRQSVYSLDNSLLAIRLAGRKFF